MLLTSITIREKIAGLWQMIGDTPIMEIIYRYKNGPEQRVLAKCEYAKSLTGSIKDRMALYILQKAYEKDQIKPGNLIVEATSGNTGISFAAIGKALGHRVKIIMPDWMSQERKGIIKSYGAEILLVSAEQGGFLGAIRLADLHQHDDKVFLPRQFKNYYNVEAHKETTGREIGHQLLLAKIKPDAFLAGVGTGGTVMGVGKFLSAFYPDICIHPLEPAESPTLSTGHKVGSHRIQGISDEFIPAIVDLKTLNKVIQVNDGDAILLAQRLGTELGLAVGISSGANLLGAIKLQLEMGNGAQVVTVLPDSNKKYLSTDLFKTEPIREGYLTPNIKLPSIKQKLTMTKRIDQKDIEILNILQSNCRTRLQPMADQIGLTTSPVADRIMLLERDGYIKRYGAVINKLKLGLDYRAFVRVQLLPDGVVAFEDAVASFHEVECAYQLSDDSFLLLVAVRDVRAYSRLIVRLQSANLIVNHRTFPLKKEFKTYACLPGLNLPVL